MGIFDKVKAKRDALASQYGQQSAAQSPQAAGTDKSTGGQIPDLPLGPESVVRFRKQRGVNLGKSYKMQRDLRPAETEVRYCRCLVLTRSLDYRQTIRRCCRLSIK